jgi:regulator of protease activity HflC (stomatin/prohibitin superfamily)
MTMLIERDKLNADIQEILDKQTDAWGIKVANVGIKDVDLNENMIRSIAKQAEAERLRRAKVINAEGEQQAAEKLVSPERSAPGPPDNPSVRGQLRSPWRHQCLRNCSKSELLRPGADVLREAFSKAETQ